MPLNIDGAGAFDGAGHTALVDDVVILRENLAAYLFKVLILAVGVISRGEYAAHLHGADKSGGAHFGELVAGERMLAQRFRPFLIELRRFFGIEYRHLVISGSDHGFEIFRAEHSADAGASGCSLAAYNGGVFDQIFTRGADGEHAALDSALARLVHPALELLLRLRNLHAPEVAGFVEEELVVFYLDPGGDCALAADDQCVDARFLEIVPEIAAAVRGGGYPGQRGEGGYVEAVGAGRSRAGERTR